MSAPADGLKASSLAWPVLLGLCGLKLALHLALSTRYGYHSDELYFIEFYRIEEREVAVLVVDITAHDYRSRS